MTGRRMWRGARTTGVLLVVAACACAGPRVPPDDAGGPAAVERDDWQLPQDQWATTCDAAARDFLDTLTPEGRAEFRAMGRDQLAVFHLGLGFRVRGRQGLAAGNTALMQSCGTDYPDDASMAIIQRAWEMEHRSAKPKPKAKPKRG